ncbi:conjugal transfer protein TraD [Sphingomonas sp. PB4P5]|uniref:conjugal transfer protein TraD n=1 Tax=Parasphingomonas puruogangriensis TaxID=3096155 RepID=UPI002FC99426
MRKPRDFDAELKALSDKARLLKEHRVRQLGGLVIATGADVLPLEQLAGALLGAAQTKEQSTMEGWRRRGAAFFQVARKVGGGAREAARREQADHGGAPSATGEERA